ncbi:MAG: cation diffusion facilitator family transporter [Promethearchaeota archaeon]
MSIIKDNEKLYTKPEFVNLVLLITYIILIILKLAFSFISNSIALRADAFDNLNDIVMYATAMLGFILVRKKPNKQYPYGYYKIENIISLFFALFIFFNAYNIFIESISSIIAFINGNPNPLEISNDLFLFLIISILISSLMTIYLKIISKKTNVPIIETEANEKKVDVLISTSVFIGVIGAFFKLYLLDPVLGLLITIFIVKGGYEIFISSMRTLLDAVVEFDKRTELYDLIKNFPTIKEVENIEIRSYGRFIFLEVSFSLNENIPQYKVDVLKSKLTDQIKAKFPKIFKVVFNTHGKQIKELRIAVPLEDNLANSSPISEHFGESNYFALLDFEENRLKKMEILENPFRKVEKRKGLLVSDFLISKKIDYIFLKKPLNKGPSLIFENNFVDLEITDFNILQEIINLKSN